MEVESLHSVASSNTWPNNLLKKEFLWDFTMVSRTKITIIISSRISKNIKSKESLRSNLPKVVKTQRKRCTFRSWLRQIRSFSGNICSKKKDWFTSVVEKRWKRLLMQPSLKPLLWNAKSHTRVLRSLTTSKPKKLSSSKSLVEINLDFINFIYFYFFSFYFLTFDANLKITQSIVHHLVPFCWYLFISFFKLRVSQCSQFSSYWPVYEHNLRLFLTKFSVWSISWIISFFLRFHLIFLTSDSSTWVLRSSIYFKRDSISSSN